MLSVIHGKTQFFGPFLNVSLKREIFKKTKNKYK